MLEKLSMLQCIENPTLAQVDIPEGTTAHGESIVEQESSVSRMEQQRGTIVD